MKKKSFFSWFRKFLRNHESDFESLPEARAEEIAENLINWAVTTKNEEKDGENAESAGVSEKAVPSDQEADRDAREEELEDDGIPHFTGCVVKERFNDDIFSLAREA